MPANVHLIHCADISHQFIPNGIFPDEVEGRIKNFRRILESSLTQEILEDEDQRRLVLVLLISYSV